MRAGSGMALGGWVSSCSPLVSVTSKPTDGIVASRSRSYSRSSRSRTMSMCSSPRKPTRKPKPSASLVSGSQGSAASLGGGFSRAQCGVVVAVDREDAAEHHRLDLAVAGERLGRLARLRRERVADAQLRDVLDPGDEVADLAGMELV